jgi:hypothetical protein
VIIVGCLFYRDIILVAIVMLDFLVVNGLVLIVRVGFGSWVGQVIFFCVKWVCCFLVFVFCFFVVVFGGCLRRDMKIRGLY